VFAVVGVLVGVQLQLNVGGTDAVIRAEPRFGIIVSSMLVVWSVSSLDLDTYDAISDLSSFELLFVRNTTFSI
jgi:hypothetical protein